MAKQQTPEPVKVHIRWIVRSDMPVVLEIEREAFEFPWSEDDFLRCLRQRNVIAMVADHDDEVLGFMIYELQPRGLHVLNLAVAEAWRGRSIGWQMVEKLKGKLGRRKTQLVLEVRETNLAAQVFFRRQSFRAVGVLKDFYEDTTEAAYLFRYRKPEPAGVVDRLRAFLSLL